MCGYNLLPIECRGPAAKFKLLQHPLLSGRDGNERSLRRDHPRSIVPSEPNPPPSQPQPHAAVADSIISPTADDQAAGFGISFVKSLLQPLSRNDAVEDLLRSTAAECIVSDSAVTTILSPHGFRQLPPYEATAEVIHVAFNSIFGLCNVVLEQAFCVAMQRLYGLDPNSYTSEDTEFVPLFCSVLALGMLYASGIHQELGYENVIQERYARK